MLIVILVIVVAFFLIMKVLGNSEEKTTGQNSKPIAPPTKDVYILGCQLGDCGYAVMDFNEKGKGKHDPIAGVVYCGYQRKQVPAGSECPFAKAHPELLRDGTFYCD